MRVLRRCPIRRLCAAATGAKTHLHTPQATVAAYSSLWHNPRASSAPIRDEMELFLPLNEPNYSVSEGKPKQYLCCFIVCVRF